jgi:alkaline phosphatase D
MVAAASAQPAQIAGSGVGPMVGHVEAQSAQIWLEVGEAERVQVWIGETASSLPVDRRSGGFGVVRLEGLAPDTEHAVRVRLPVTGEELEVRFRTAPVAAGWGKVRFGVGSCARWDQQPIWDQVAKAAPDMFLFLGDNTYYERRQGGYADWDDEGRMFARHLRSRRLPNLQAVLRSTPTYAVWDDHDYGPNNSDSGWKLRGTAREVHRSMWANPGYGEDGEGIYFTFRRGPVAFFMLDGRFFKDAVKTKPLAERVLFGAKQLDWLQRQISASDAPLKVIAAGQQLVLGYPYAEGWDQAPEERRRFFEWLKRDGSRVLFLPGDIHISELYQVPVSEGRNWLELTSSGLANTSRFNDMFRMFKRPERKWVVTVPNACVVEVDLPQADPEEGTLVFTSVDAKGGVQARTEVPLRALGPGRVRRSF